MHLRLAYGIKYANIWKWLCVHFIHSWKRCIKPKFQVCTAVIIHVLNINLQSEGEQVKCGAREVLCCSPIFVTTAKARRMIYWEHIGLLKKRKKCTFFITSIQSCTLRDDMRERERGMNQRILSRVRSSVTNNNGFWIGCWIYWPLTGRNNK
jgi:hypothetical protein